MSRPKGRKKQDFDWVDAIVFRLYVLGDPYFATPTEIQRIVGHRTNTFVYQRAKRIQERIEAGMFHVKHRVHEGTYSGFPNNSPSEPRRDRVF